MCSAMDESILGLWRQASHHVSLYFLCPFSVCADDHEHVYVSSFRRLLKQSQLLDPALLANDVRIVLENAYTEADLEAKKQAQLQ